jgi:hypothetical protein
MRAVAYVGQGDWVRVGLLVLRQRAKVCVPDEVVAACYFAAGAEAAAECWVQVPDAGVDYAYLRAGAEDAGFVEPRDAGDAVRVVACCIVGRENLAGNRLD